MVHTDTVGKLCGRLCMPVHSHSSKHIYIESIDQVRTIAMEAAPKHMAACMHM